MKKLLGSLVLIISLSFSALAQDEGPKYKVSLGGEFLYVIGNAVEFHNVGYGASLQGEYKLSPKLNVTASGGYISLGVSKLYNDIYSPWLNGSVKSPILYPVKAGLKYKFHKKIYAAAEAGAAIAEPNAVRGTSFAYAGGLGTNFEVSSKSSIDVGIRYEGWSLNTNNTYSFVGLRAAYVFGFK